MRALYLSLVLVVACSPSREKPGGHAGSGGTAGAGAGSGGGAPGGSGGTAGGGSGGSGGTGGSGGLGGGGSGGSGGMGGGGAGGGGSGGSGGLGGSGGGGAGGSGGGPVVFETCEDDGLGPVAPVSQDARFGVEVAFGARADRHDETVANVRAFSTPEGPEIFVTEPLDGRLDVLRPRGKSCTRQVITRGLVEPVRAVPVDLDGDGTRDLLVADIGDLFPTTDPVGRVLLYSAWETSEPQPRVLLEGVGRTTCAEPADLDGDGDLDVAVCVFGHETGELLWLEQKDGEFLEHVLEDRPGAIHAYPFDADGDGDVDLVSVLAQDEERVLLMRNDGKGNFTREVLFQSDASVVEGFTRLPDVAALPADYGMSGIRPVDLDHDGDIDVLVTNGDVLDGIIVQPAENFYGVAWLENDGKGGFTWHDIQRFSCTYGAAAGDLDGDGDVDVVLTSFLGGDRETQPRSAVWLENDGAQNFTMHDLLRAPPGYPTVEIVDWDGDGHLDVLPGGMFGQQVPRVFLLRNLTP